MVEKAQGTPSLGSETTVTESSVLTPNFLLADTSPDDDFWPHNREATGSSILERNSVLENGRLFQGYKYGKYFLPNDGEEQDRLDLQHAAIDILLDERLSWAPVEEGANVLDIGTGTGIWAVQYASQNPSSHVIGTDLSLIQPQDVAPPNCVFIREDAEEDFWTLDRHFEYIHLRMMFTCFESPLKVLSNIFYNLAPGGWVEFQEPTMECLSFDDSVVGSSIERWSQSMIRGARAGGRDLLYIKRYKELMESVGFVDVQQTILPFPISQWADEPKFKRVGALTQLMWSQPGAMEGASLKLLQAAGLSSIEIKELVAAARRDTRNRDIHGFYPFYVIYGRKPPLNKKS